MRKLRVLVLMHRDFVPPESLRGLSEAQVDRMKSEIDVTEALGLLGHEVRELGVHDELFPLRAALGKSAAPLELCAAQALRVFAFEPSALPAFEGMDAAALAQRLAAFDPGALGEAARHNLPDWLWQALHAQYGAEAAALAGALNREACVETQLRIAGREGKRLLEGGDRLAHFAALRVKVAEHAPGFAAAGFLAHDLLECAQRRAVEAEKQQRLRPAVQDRAAQRSAHCFLSMSAEQS